MDSDSNDGAFLHHMFDMPTWLTGRPKLRDLRDILRDDGTVPNTTVNNLDPLAPENDNCFGTASPTEDPEGMAGCNACSAQQAPPGSSCPAGLHPPCTAGGGQYKGMPSLPVRPPKALPILPTPPTPAPEPPSVHAVPGPQPMNIDDHETAAQRGGGNGMVHRSDDTKEEGELPSASTDAAGAVAQELDQAAGDTEASALHGAAPSASKDAAGVAAHEPDQAAGGTEADALHGAAPSASRDAAGAVAHEPDQAAGDTESEGLHGAAPSASKNAVEVAAQEPDLSANPDVPMAQQAAAQRPALTECTLVGFDWQGVRHKLHVLREKGADCLSGAIMVTELRKLPVPKPAWSSKMVCRTWNDMARALKIRSQGTASWVSSTEEQEALEKHGAFCFTRGCRAVRMLLVTVALEELGRVSKGYEDDLASLKAALAAGQPASPAESGEILNGDQAETNPCSDDAPLAALRQNARLPKEVSGLPEVPPPLPLRKRLRKRPRHLASTSRTGTSDSVPPDQQKPQTPPKQAPRRGAASKKHRRAKMNGATEPSHHVSQAESVPRTNGEYTEAQYRAHMNLRKDAMARLGSVFIQESMEFAAGKDAQIEKEQRDNTELRKKCSALEKLCAELRAARGEASTEPLVSYPSSLPYSVSREF